jgi:hypothetical protein
MAIKVKLEPLSQDIKLFVNEMLSPQAQSKAIAEFARGEIDAADRVNASALGRAPKKTVTVDGSRNAPLESVKPTGVIIAEWDLFVGVFSEVHALLVQRSPKVSGAYIRGHKLFADGTEIGITNNPPPANEYAFVNIVPYARKIEIGKTQAGRDFVIQVPNRIYERTAQDARSRFGNIAKVSFSYRSVTGGSRAPAIIIKPLDR